MVGRTGFYLIVILFSLVETVTSQKGPYSDMSLVTLHNCEATFDFDKLNYSSLNLYSKQMGLNITLLHGQNYVRYLPANKTIIFNFKVDNGMENTITVESPGNCCNETIIHDHFACYTLKLKCEYSCYGIYPETPDFFTFPGSSKCSSIYCYRGGNGSVQISVPLQRSHHNYTLSLYSYPRYVVIVEFLIEGKAITLKTYYPGPFKVLPQKYRQYVKESDFNDYYRSILLATNTTFSPEGDFHVMLRNKGMNRYLVQDYHVYAFKKVHCNIEKIDYDQDMWPLPMYSFNCTNSLSMELKYEFENRIDNRWYTLSGSKMEMSWVPDVNSTVAVSVSYRNFSSSKSVYNMSIFVKHHFMSLKSKLIPSSLFGFVSVPYRYQRPGNISDYVILVPIGKAGRRFIAGYLSHFFNRGLTILEYYATVGQLYITNLTASEDSKNRYVFTCLTNSTFTYLTYQWYWNENEITNEFLQITSMQNGKSEGSIILSGLNKNDSGYVTCHVKKPDFIPATSRRWITKNYFPVVKMNASHHIIQNKKPVNVTCESVSNLGNSELIFKVNNQQIKKKKVTLSEEATVSCYGVSNGFKGEVKIFKILKAVGKKLCPAETYNNIKWPETVENTIANAACSEGFSGTISRLCSPDGIWKIPDKSNCLKKTISDAKSKLDRIALGVDKGFESAVENLVNATKQSIGAKDITETLDALKVVSAITNKSKEVSKNEIKNFIKVVDNLIKGDTKTAWTKLENQEPSSAASILKLVEDFGNIAAPKVNETISVSTEHLVIEYNKVSVDKNVNFPTEKSSQPKWVEESGSRIFIPSTILKNKFGAKETVSMNAVIFKSITDLLPQAKKVGSDVNSVVLAISFGKKMGNLTENVLLSFTHLSSVYDELSCNFWDFNINPEFGGYWSTRGCEVSFTNSTYTQCSCDHLTNFAILMNVVQHKESEVLGIITKVGCSISIIFLVLTIIIYARCWKSVTSGVVSKSQSILLMNLCASLIIAYLIFLTLVQETRDKNICTAIAIILHYIFLVVFCAMLAEGVDMAITLMVVFNTRFSRLPWLLAFSWVAPAIIVGISLAIKKTRGFGNDVHCWLTTESNVIWSFIIPALIIILANIVCVVLIVKSIFSAHCVLRESVKDRLRTGVRAIGILTPLLGFTWIFGIFAVNEKTVVFAYIFTVANSLQGLFIFISSCILNKRIWKGLNLSKSKRTTQEPTKQPTQSTPAKQSTENISANNSKQELSVDDSLPS